MKINLKIKNGYLYLKHGYLYMEHEFIANITCENVCYI